MIIITAEWKAKPGQEVLLLKQLETMVQSVRQGEPKCLQYTLHQGWEDKSRFYFYERYEDMSAIEFHKNTLHFKKLIAETENLIAEPVRVNLYQVLK